MFFKSILVIVAINLISDPAKAVALMVQSLCSDRLILSSNIPVNANDNVGIITIKALDLSSLAYIGSVEGITSIDNSPTGNNAVEVISPTQMRAYGWCYSVNDIQPDAMPNEVKIISNNDIVHWYFGYAEYSDGEWISYCTPTHLTRPDFICAKEATSGE